jgi:hypothetical protein
MRLEAVDAFAKFVVMDGVIDDCLMISANSGAQFGDAGIKVVELASMADEDAAVLVHNIKKLIELAVVAIEPRGHAVNSCGHAVHSCGHAVHSRGHVDQELIDRPNIDSVAALCHRAAAFRLRKKDTETAPNPQIFAIRLVSARAAP